MQKVIKETDAEIRSNISSVLFDSNTDQLNEVLHHIIKLKRQFDRAFFARLSCDMAGGNWLNHLPILSVLEILDCCVLAMDDILDRSERRVGLPTLHLKWGLGKALCAIEFIKSQCITIVVDHLKNENELRLMPNIIKLLEELYQGIYEGQFIDIYFEEKDISEIGYKDITNMVQLTTGIQIAICGELGSMMGGADMDMQKDLRQFGMLLGTLFQIRDDFIDYFDNEDAIGKPAYLDFSDGKKRFPVIIAYKTLKDVNLKAELKEVCNRNTKSNHYLKKKVLNNLTHYMISDEFKVNLYNIIGPIKEHAYSLIMNYKDYPRFDYMMNLLELSTNYE